MTGPSVETDARECQRHLDHSSDVFIVILQVPAAIALSPLSIVELHSPFSWTLWDAMLDASFRTWTSLHPWTSLHRAE